MSNPAPPTSHPIDPKTSTGFWSLFATQFQGAFSDNIFKFLVTFIIIGLGLPQETRDRFVPVVGALFSLPFILFSMTGGFLADRLSKRTVVRWTKVAEIFIMALGAYGLWERNLYVLLFVVFLMSSQSAFFGPSKYGLLPEILPARRLSWGNGVINLGTFVAIITGTITAGWLSKQFSNQVYSGLVLVVLAILGWTFSGGIQRVKPANPNKQHHWHDFLTEPKRQFSLIRKDTTLFWVFMGGNFFWFLGALLQPTILIYGKDILKIDDFQSGILQAALAIGIGIGSFVAGYLSGRHIQFGLIPIGAMGLVLFSCLLCAPWMGPIGAGITLALLGFFGGLFVVPIAAFIQFRPAPEHKGTVLATYSYFNFVGVFIASGMYYLLTGLLKFSPPLVFLSAGLLTLPILVVSLIRVPDFWSRLLRSREGASMEETESVHNN